MSIISLELKAINVSFSLVPKSRNSLITLRFSVVIYTVITVESCIEALPPVSCTNEFPTSEMLNEFKRMISSSTMVLARTVSSNVRVRVPRFMLSSKSTRNGAVVSSVKLDAGMAS